MNPAAAPPPEGSRWVGRVIVLLIVGPALIAALSLLARWLW